MGVTTKSKQIGEGGGIKNWGHKMTGSGGKSKMWISKIILPDHLQHHSLSVESECSRGETMMAVVYMSLVVCVRLYRRG